MTHLEPYAVVILRSFMQAQDQLTTRFREQNRMDSANIAMLNAYIGITGSNSGVLYVTERMQAEDHLEHLLADMIRRPRPLEVQKRERTQRGMPTLSFRGSAKNDTSHELRAYATELMGEGIDTYTAYALAEFLANARDELVAFLKTLHNKKTDPRPDARSRT